MITAVYNVKNEKIGEIDLPDFVFAAPWKPELVHFAHTAQRANSRVVLSVARGRGEVSGGGKKPWRQKGTGRARHGSTRSPIWTGGGVAHGPTAEKVFAKGINKKQKRGALFSILSKKLSDGQLKIIDSLQLESPKTKLVAPILKNLLSGKTESAIFIPAKDNIGFNRASRNLPKTVSLNPESLNVSDLVTHRQVFIEKDAVPVIVGHYALTKPAAALEKAAPTVKNPTSTKS